MCKLDSDKPVARAHEQLIVALMLPLFLILLLFSRLPLFVVEPL